MMAWQNEPQLLNQPRSSAIALPSFGSEPDGTNSTEPPSLVTAQSDAAKRSCKASFGEVHSAFSVVTSLSPPRVTTRRSRPSSGWRLPDLRDLFRAYEHALDLGGLVGAAHPSLDAHVAASAGAAAR
jgi:hypothetical protein